MTQRARKLAGVFLLIGLLVAYPLLAVMVFELWIDGLPAWPVLAYFTVAGLGWALPAGLVIRWMARPD